VSDLTQPTKAQLVPEPCYTALDTTLTDEERREWHEHLLDPNTWRRVGDTAERMLRLTEKGDGDE
jgi:hypothetical protein